MVDRYRHPVFALQYELSEGDAAHLEDLAWYGERLPEGGDPLLEIAAGTGRVTRHLVRTGRRIVAFDIGAPMLRELKKHPATRDVPVVCGTMCALPFRSAAPFEAAYSAYNSLGCLLTRRDLDRTFAAVHRVLPPGRPFLFDVAVHREADWTVRSRTFDWERWKAPDGFVIRRRTKAVAKPDEQRLELTYTYRWQDPVDGAQSETVCFVLNLWPPETYLASAERNGFEPREFDERTYVSDAGRERMWAFVTMMRR